MVSWPTLKLVYKIIVDFNMLVVYYGGLLGISGY